MKSNDYNPSDIEKKWQKYWEEEGTYHVSDSVKGKENFYALSEFAYPSGNLHVGHWYAFAVPDIYARFKRMQGYNVLYPMGFDAFGLPAENAAIKHGKDPKKWTYDNMTSMRTQLRSMGASFDWNREIATCDPSYYQWTQGMFTKFLENDLIYRDVTKVNWCEHDKTILANEQVVAGKCERCGNEVVQKDMAQWMLRITEFADDLIDDLEQLPWDESIKQAQREWIGRKEGSIIPFRIQESEVYDVNRGPGDDAFREGEPIVDRNNVVVIIEHPQKDEFLCAKWKQVDWQGFVTGGIEDGVSIEDTVLNEVREETGYQNPKIVKIYDRSSHGLFWHVHKKQNRRANYRIVHVKLKDLEQIARSEEEQAIADFLWIPRNEVNDFLKREDMKYPWRIINQSNPVFGESTIDYKIRKTVKIILRNSKGEILIQRELNSNCVDLPGGGIEEGETIHEAAVRELREETEYTNFKFIDKIAHTYNYHYSPRDNSEMRADIDLLVYELENEEKTPKDEEQDSVRCKEVWATPQKVIDTFVENPVYKDFPKYWIKLYIDWNNSRVGVFTTRADTLFGATYLVLAPEHQFVQNNKDSITNWEEVETYLKEVEKKSDLDRQQSKEKTGVQLKGIEAVNSATGKPIPIWIADYVLAHFGTGAVMAVPAHDERDCEFALKYDLPFKFVILPSAGEIGNSRSLELTGEVASIIAVASTEEEGQAKINAQWNQMYDLLAEMDDGVMPPGKRFCCTFEGKLINSPGFNVKTSEEARALITDHVNGKITKTYRLRDWGISRQRYWGCPIPIVYDPEGKAHSIPNEHLPWTLPEDVDFTPDGTAPLARSQELKERTEKIFGKGWTPEVDTMDTFVDSSWYFYRYLDNNNEKAFASEASMRSWMPVDMYFGGAEHTTMHLLYSRFWTKALYKLGLVADNEPYKGRLNRGLILGPDGNKMSKSKGNVINPDEVVEHVGADTVRMYLAFIGPFNEPGNYPWDPNGVVGIKRFLERVWRLVFVCIEDFEDSFLNSNNDYTNAINYHYLTMRFEKETHSLIKNVSEDIEKLKLNTAISSLMEYTNIIRKEETKKEKTRIYEGFVQEGISMSEVKILLQLLASMAPHFSEELWSKIIALEKELLLPNDLEKFSKQKSIHLTDWPQYDENLLISDTLVLPIQINGKRRSEIEVDQNDSEEDIKQRVLDTPELNKWLEGKEIKKFIYVKNRIINIVVE